MKVQGSYTFDADRERVWNALMDPDVLSGCIPGGEQFVPSGENAYQVTMKVKIAAITGTYTGSIRLVDVDQPNSYRMMVEGKGSGGTVRGEAVMQFAESNGATEVLVEGDAYVTGMVARVGQRLMGSASKMMMNQFFACLKEKIES
jgi:hypothetical protein